MRLCLVPLKKLILFCVDAAGCFEGHAGDFLHATPALSFVVARKKSIAPNARQSQFDTVI